MANSLGIIIPIKDANPVTLYQLKSTILSIHRDLNSNCFSIYVVSRVSQLTFLSDALSDFSRVSFLEESFPSHSGALNTGIEVCTTSHVLVLNPGDMLLGLELLDAFFSSDCHDFFLFNVVSEGFWVGTTTTPPLDKSTIQIKDLKLSSFLNIPHQGLIVPLSIYHRASLLYSIDFKLRMDYEFLNNVRRQLPNLFVHRSSMPLCFYPPGGASMSITSRALFYWEAVVIDFKYSNITIFPNLLRYLYWRVRLKFKH